MSTDNDDFTGRLLEMLEFAEEHDYDTITLSTTHFRRLADEIKTLREKRAEWEEHAWREAREADRLKDLVAEQDKEIEYLKDVVVEQNKKIENLRRWEAEYDVWERDKDD